MAHPLVELKEVSKTYLAGDVRIHALRGVSFRAEQGEFITVSGSERVGQEHVPAPDGRGRRAYRAARCFWADAKYRA